MSSFFRRRRKNYEKEVDGTAFLKNGATLLEKLVTSCNGKYNPIKGFSADELKVATNNYDSQQLITYESGYELYQGYLQKRPVFVMKFGGSEGYRFCFNNIRFASQIRHKNVLKLIGCCLETDIPILFFESVKYKTTLADFIHNPNQSHSQPFLLGHRLKIAMEIANAVAYLHFGFPRPIIFKDIKPSHILLDEQFVAKLFDFSLSESIPEGETHIKDLFVVGTRGFVAPEYCVTFDCNEKCDVYSFGALLLELLTGQKIYDLARLAKEDDCAISDYVKKHAENNRYIEIIDPIIIGDGSYPGKEHMQAFIQLISTCLNTSAENRPTMVDVAKQLRQIYRSAA